MNKIFKILILGLFFISFFSIEAKKHSENKYDAYKAGSHYYAYPYTYSTPPAQTPVPDGYKPFHLEHYGRHGSRWHIGNYNYDKSFELLERAYNDSMLTQKGEHLYNVVKNIRNEFNRGRDGELSDLGAIQHYVLGKRIANNYPEIFENNPYIDARSTVVIRCILSMQNSLKGMQSRYPDLNIKTDASQADMWYMNYEDEKSWKARHKADSIFLKPFKETHKNGGRYLMELIKDKDYAEKNIGDTLFTPLFNLLVNMQSHLDQPWILENIFTQDEIIEGWKNQNANWFIRSGNSKMTDNLMPKKQYNLLTNIIESADTAMNSKNISVNLRYGHDSVIFPLVTLLNLNGYGEEINDLETLDIKGWRDYEVVPMGANLQFVFYKNENISDDNNILIKVLLNEEEAELPFENYEGPYYSWKKFKEYYLNKMKDK